MFVEIGCLRSHASCCGEDEGGEGGMFYFPHSLLVGPLLFTLVLPVASRGCQGLVRWSVGVEDSYVEECLLRPPPPHSIG